VLFASEIKALLEHPQVSRDVDSTALYHYMTLYTTPAPLTMFRGIYKLPAGHAMVVEDGRDPRVYNYWDPIVPRERFERAFRGSGEPGVEAYCVKEIRRLLSESIEKRMMSDVPFGVFLSGGVDSSTNVALMARLMDRPVDTFTVAFKDNPQYNELEYARRIAREFKTNHHEVLIDESDLLEYLPDLIYHQDEPIADPVCVPLYYVSKLARDNGTTVIQVGEGSDEQFCGYPWNVTFQRIYEGPWKWFRRLPRAMRIPAAHMALLASRSRWTGRRRMPAFGAELAMRAAYDQELFWGGAVAFLETVKQRYVNRDAFDKEVTVPYFQGLGDSFLGNHQHLSSATVVGAFADHLRREKPEADFLEQMIYMEFKHRLPELLLMRVDKITMSTSVEARVPFLDHALAEFTMNIPPALKIHHGETKHILKKAVEGLIPRDIIYRPKQGFATPVDAWMETELGREMRHTFQTTRFRRRGFLRFDRVDAEMKGPSSRRAGSAYWVLFNFLKWYDRWIEGQP
jgi:asparagine synthase (glutamine-hydrolysing)